MTLPDTKNVPGRDPLNKKTLIHALPKVGKSTLVSTLYPNAAFIATDPTGLEELEVYKADCRDWATFRRIGQELALYLRDNPPGTEGCIYDAICIDTADELARFCRFDVLSQLTGGPVSKGANDFLHPSDWEYGKGWEAVREEFRIRIAKLCNLGLPVVFISHSKPSKKKNRVGQEITTFSPDVGGGGLGDWLEKFVDYIFFAEVITSKEGERRVIHTMPSETYLAGARLPNGSPLLPDPLPLDGARLRSALLATAAEADSNGKPDGEIDPTMDPSLLPEPGTIRNARKTIAQIDEEEVQNSGYTAKQRKALDTIAKYEAKQKETAGASA